MPPSRLAPRSSPGDGGVSPPEQPEHPTEPITTITAQIRIHAPSLDEPEARTSPVPVSTA